MWKDTVYNMVTHIKIYILLLRLLSYLYYLSLILRFLLKIFSKSTIHGNHVFFGIKLLCTAFSRYIGHKYPHWQHLVDCVFSGTTLADH